MPASKAKAKAVKAEDKQASPLKTSRKRPASSTSPAEAHSPDMVRTKKMKGDAEESDQDPQEKGLFAIPVNDTTKGQVEYIKRLEERVDSLQTTVMTLRHDRIYMNGAYDGWPGICVGAWSDGLRAFMYSCQNWSCSYGFRSNSGKYGHLSKEQKKQLISSMEGYVLQDDFDRILPRLPPNIRCNILCIFAEIILIKEILSLFFTNPFWYLEWPDGQGPNNGKGSGIETPFSAQLSHLYQTFLETDAQLAHHWRAQTVRLSNATTIYQTRSTDFGRKNRALREAKIKEVVAARLADKNFQCLLKAHEDPDWPDRREIVLFGVYKQGAELAMKIATSQPNLEWQTLEGVPSEFQRSSKKIEPAHIHGLRERESRLNGHPVLAVTQPAFWQTGGWNKLGKDRLIKKAEVLVEDPIGLPEDALSPDEDEKAKRKKRQPKKVKEAIDKEADDEKPAPKGKKKKATKNKG